MGSRRLGGDGFQGFLRATARETSIANGRERGSPRDFAGVQHTRVTDPRVLRL